MEQQMEQRTQQEMQQQTGQQLQRQTQPITQAGFMTVAEDGRVVLPPIKMYMDNDTGNAQRFLDAYGEQVLYCPSEKRWYVFDDVRWVPDTTNQVERMARQALEQSYARELEYYHAAERSGMMQGQVQKASRRQQAAGNLSGLRSCVGMAALENTIDPSQFDADPYWLNLPNGAMNLRELKIRNHHRPEQYFTKVTRGAFLYDLFSGRELTAEQDGFPAICPHWFQFVMECCMGDADLYLYLQRAAGYSALTGDISEQKVFCLAGAGRNGKSLFINTMAMVLGDYASKIEASVLCRNRYGERDNDLSKELYRIRGSYLVYSNEFGQNSMLNEAFIKAITDGGKISCRPLYGASIEYTPTYTLWFSTNHLPNLQAMDAGIRRRIEVIPFQNHVPEELVDRNLASYFEAEADAILVWLFTGYWEYLQQGLNPPAVVQQATAQYFAEQDVFAQFVEEHYQKHAEGKLYAKEIYQAYTVWCAETGQQRASQVVLSRELQRLDIEKRKDRNGMYYTLRKTL